MRVSEAIPRGRKVHLYHPELFSNHEEVIIYTRDEFRRNYLAMREYIEYAFKQYGLIDSERDFELAGYWARIMERIHFLNVNTELLLDKKTFEKHTQIHMSRSHFIHPKISPHNM